MGERKSMKIICGKPQVSAYNFMRYLCAILATQGKVIVDLSSLTYNIFKFKGKVSEEFQFLFDDIEFRTGIDNNVASNDISEGLNSLQTFGIIGKLNPTYEKIVIYLTPDEAENILESCDQKIVDVLNKLAEEF